MSDIIENIILLGVGGGAARFVSETVRKADVGMRAVVFDGDRSTAELCAPDVEFCLLGEGRLDGHGTGGQSIKGRAAVQDDAELVKAALNNVRLAVVVVSLGGGFGSGATPEILNILRECGVTIFCVATLPFEFEGPSRVQMARKHLALLEDSGGAFAAIKLDDLFADTKGLPIPEAYGAATDIMSDLLSIYWSLLVKPGFVTFNVEQMCSIISASVGRCRFAIASATGEGRASIATQELFKSPLLGAESKVEGAGTVILGVLASKDLRLVELTEISEVFQSHLSVNSTFLIGTVIDESFEGTVKLIAIFFDSVEEANLEVSSDPFISDEKKQRRSKKDLLGTGTPRHTRSVNATIYDGQDLDIPTYVRREIKLDP